MARKIKSLVVKLHAPVGVRYKSAILDITCKRLVMKFLDNNHYMQALEVAPGSAWVSNRNVNFRCGLGEKHRMKLVPCDGPILLIKNGVNVFFRFSCGKDTFVSEGIFMLSFIKIFLSLYS